MNNSPLILIIDDEQAISKTLQESLEDEGFRTQAINDGNKALNTIGELIPDMVLLDIFMPNCNGLELLSNIKREYPNQKVIIISGFGNISLAVEAVKTGALDFIEKPLNLDDVLSKLAYLKTNYAPSDKTGTTDNFSTKDVLYKHGIIGESALFNELITQINNVSNLKYPLLIYGRHGTGKTLISKYVHSISNLKNMPFSIIDCSSEFNLTLNPLKISGVIFFKNIDRLNHENQAILLQFLQDPIYQEKNMLSEIRIIASSSNPLFNLVQTDKWSGQLFYKLNITPLEIPSLSKRRHDIPLLANFFLETANKQLNKNISLCNLSIRYLRNRNWIGNVTDLKNFIYNVVELSKNTDAQILLAEIKPLLHEQEIEFIEEQTFLSFKSLDEATNTFQKQYLSYIIKKNNFDLDQIANKLNLSVEELKTKLSALNINPKKLNLD